MGNEIIDMCLKLINEENVQHELKKIYTPIVNSILQVIMPYIYLAIIFIIINFILLLLIFCLLFQNKIPKLRNLFYKVKI